MIKSKRKLLDDCFLHDKDRLLHSEAIILLQERLSGICNPELIKLSEAYNHILAQDIISNINIPPTDNSAVDGFAFASSDYETTGGFFPVVTRIAAGDTNDVELPSQSAARIFTGAVMPQNADTIAMQEDCEIHEQDDVNFVAIPPGLKHGANRRRAGEDHKQGDVICKSGELLNPQKIAAIASSGTSKFKAYKPLRIAVLSSGNELKRPGEALQMGQSFDSNHFLLTGLLKNLPVEITDLGILADDYALIEASFKDAAKNHDVIITTGGASRGEEDHIIEALDAIGKRHLWQLAVKPGRPMSFGQIADTAFFGLPGNPVASFVCFLLYVRPALIKLAGGNWSEPKRYQLPALFEVPKKKADRREFWRGIYEITSEGNAGLQKFERDGSGLISGLTYSHGLIEIPEDVSRVSKGDMLSFIPYSEFGIL